jgi:hypothetical protein
MPRNASGRQAPKPTEASGPPAAAPVATDSAAQPSGFVVGITADAARQAPPSPPELDELRSTERLAAAGKGETLTDVTGPGPQGGTVSAAKGRAESEEASRSTSASVSAPNGEAQADDASGYRGSQRENAMQREVFHYDRDTGREVLVRILATVAEGCNNSSNGDYTSKAMFALFHIATAKYYRVRELLRTTEEMVDDAGANAGRISDALVTFHTIPGKPPPVLSYGEMLRLCVLQVCVPWAPSSRLNSCFALRISFPTCLSLVIAASAYSVLIVS